MFLEKASKLEWQYYEQYHHHIFEYSEFLSLKEKHFSYDKK
jgi:hypothetical protein